MLDIEALRYELQKVSEVVEKHTKVAEKAGISVKYLEQIRKGKNVTLDNEKNRLLISSLIAIYRKIGKDKINALVLAIEENKNR